MFSENNYEPANNVFRKIMRKESNEIFYSVQLCWDRRNVLIGLENVYMKSEVNSNRFEISNRFEMVFRLHGNLHGDFTAAAFQTIARLYCTCANYNF